MTQNVLNSSMALAIYKQYLTTPRLDYKEEMKKPIRSNIFKAMCKTHNAYLSDTEALINNHHGRVLYWSDQHFFHENIIHYTKRPFNSIAEMNQAMVDNYNKIVTDNDLIIFGGDIGFYDIEETKKLMKDFKGKKILVLGNHDFNQKGLTYRDYKIFDSVSMVFSFSKKIEQKDMNFIVSHYPIDEIMLPPDTINIHGHTHIYDAGAKRINISVEKLNYQPQDLIEQIKQEVDNYF